MMVVKQKFFPQNGKQKVKKSPLIPTHRVTRLSPSTEKSKAAPDGQELAWRSQLGLGLLLRAKPVLQNSNISQGHCDCEDQNRNKQERDKTRALCKPQK